MNYVYIIRFRLRVDNLLIIDGEIMYVTRSLNQLKPYRFWTILREYEICSKPVSEY